jgi:hypothetical protein
MSEWIHDLRGALLFDTETFIRMRLRPDAVWRGMLFIIIVALLAGLPAFIIEAARGLQAREAIEAGASQATAQLEQGLQQAAPFLQNVPPQVLDQIRQNFQMGVRIGTRIAELPAFIPRPLGNLLRAAGHWLSEPFGRGLIPLAAASLATWLGYGIWVLVYAKMLGGRADLRGFFGATSLYATPHLLNIFAVVPVLGPIFAVIAFFWGLAIYVKGAAVSNEISTGRALIAVLLPVIIFSLIALMLLAVIGFGILSIVHGNR